MVSDNVKFWIFYGFIILWCVWGIVDYFFSYAFQIYLGIVSLMLMVCIAIVGWRNMNMVMMAGSVRIDNSIRIP